MMLYSVIVHSKLLSLTSCRYHGYHEGDEESRKLRNANYADMVNKYYDLVTSFYEYGWGESFHFAPRLKGESFRESIKRYEHFIALQLGLKPGMKVLDVGCGVGGPLREIARFSLTSITGVNNNEYQISRGIELNRIAGLDETCDFVKADFMKMPFPDDNFDAIYAIEATCHAADVVCAHQTVFVVEIPICIFFEGSYNIILVGVTNSLMKIRLDAIKRYVGC
ncbi:hypothetical protein AMTR_s00103p00092610 [Amborella trichopoda]|uniref:SAM-dependent methyltransferase Erg6/SMT-type domain-containing protein n=1 Tax=Amborella trichopoda TaxID=13333 RepID=W1NYX4_AMBTC|nr:hypothetical protein AMTR_s00103p00092610 [Amborella trichopoda]